MALMFGRNSRSQPKNVVEFRAGKMTLKGNMVHPDKRKGLVYIYQSEDGLTHFCWKDRTSAVVEDDLIIFPDDAVFSKVTQCKGEDRVFLLKFKASSRKMFYWMQEPKVEGDADVVFNVNYAINNPGAAGSSSRGGGSGSATTTPSEQEMQNLLSNMTQSQLMQLIGGMNDIGGASGLLAQMGLGGLGAGGGSGGAEGRSSTATATPAAAPAANNSSSAKKAPEASGAKPAAASGSSKPAVQLQDLQKILSGMQSPSPAAVDLAAGVNSEFVKRITACPSTVQKLTPLLPSFGLTSSDAKQSDEKNVADTLISPAFQHALSSFCSAFPTGQLGPLVEQFEFGSDAVQAARSGNLEAFLNAIQKEADSKPPAVTEKPEDMNVD